MFVKRVLTSLSIIAAAVAAIVLPAALPASATNPTLIKIDSLGGHFNQAMSTVCGIDNSGTGGTQGAVWCWGDNTFGQLGNGTNTSSATPVRVTANAVVGFNNTQVTAISVGNTSACALEGGSIYCWGLNAAGQLGNGTTTDSTTAVKVSNNASFTNANVSMINVGSQTACAINSTVLFCWGSNAQGRLGINVASSTTASSNVPMMVADNVASSFVNGSMVDVEVGYTHACAVRDFGNSTRKMFCWGNNMDKHVNGTSDTIFLAPTSVSTGTGFSNTNVTEMSVGEAFSCAVEASSVYCWGGNGGSVTPGAPSAVPVKIAAANGFANTAVTAVSAGAYLTCALEGGKAFCWGSNLTRGAGANPPSGAGAALVATTADFPNANVTEVENTPFGACGLEGGKVSCWGMLPDAGNADSPASSPVALLWPVAPALTSSPATVSPTGGSLTITGSGFTGTSAVTIGSTAAVFVVDNAGSITITVPALTAGAYTITITTPGGPITQTLTIGAAPTTAPATSEPATTSPASTQPATSAPASGASASQTPSLVTASNQAQLTRLPGQAVVVQNGVEVTASLTNVASSAAAAASTPQAQRSAVQIAEIQAAGATLLTSFRASLPQGATSTVSVSNTATGAVVQGLAFDASGNSIDIPVEDVLLITTPTSALLLGGVDASNAAANLTANGVLEIGAGGIINVAGSGLPGAAAAELVVMSTPRLLKSFSAGADGTFADRAALPTDLPAGNHTVVLAGSGIYMAVGITVEATLLPTTGSSSTPVVVFALFVLVFGVLFIRSRRNTVNN